MNFGNNLSPAEEKALAKKAQATYASSLDSQITADLALGHQTARDHATHYYLGDSKVPGGGLHTPPPTGNVWKEMRDTQKEKVKSKADNYCDALDSQVAQLKTHRAAPVSSCQILVASRAAQKLRAVQTAVSNATLVGVSASSGVADQPTGLDETWTGARNRMDQCLSHDAARTADFAVAIENGIVSVGPDFVDVAVVIVRDVKGNLEATSTSGGVQIPSSYIDLWRDSNKFATVGEVIAAENNCDKQDPHAFLSQAKFDRASLLAEATKIAFSTLWRKSNRFV